MTEDDDWQLPSLEGELAGLDLDDSGDLIETGAVLGGTPRDGFASAPHGRLGGTVYERPLAPGPWAAPSGEARLGGTSRQALPYPVPPEGAHPGGTPYGMTLWGSSPEYAHLGGTPHGMAPWAQGPLPRRIGAPYHSRESFKEDLARRILAQ
jgi:hypothetical protein